MHSLQRHAAVQADSALSRVTARNFQTQLNPSSPGLGIAMDEKKKKTLDADRQCKWLKKFWKNIEK